MEGVYIESGLLHLEGYASANTTEHTALVPLLAGVAASVSGAEKHVTAAQQLSLCHAAAIPDGRACCWAHRCGMSRGGSTATSADIVALGLYCFSPMAIGSASQIGPAIVGAWGGFGLIFTSIAVAHTLYAPREVVLWNWRRILLHGPFHRDLRWRAVFVLGVAAAGAAVHACGWDMCGHGPRWSIFAAACVVGLRACCRRSTAFARWSSPWRCASADWLEVASRSLFAAGNILRCYRHSFCRTDLGLLHPDGRSPWSRLWSGSGPGFSERLRR